MNFDLAGVAALVVSTLLLIWAVLVRRDKTARLPGYDRDRMGMAVIGVFLLALTLGLLGFLWFAARR
jgi:dolichyl-phosphate-mannose--protein O-mannosyl transferase